MTCNWRAATPPQPIEAGEIHVWAWEFSSSASAVRCPDSFDEDERSRFASFRFDRDRFRFASAHQKLRLLLASYCGVDPGDLRFIRNAFGKPSLDTRHLPTQALQQSGDRSALCFNLTHTRHHALLAVSRGIELGIDLEEIAPIEQEVAENHFSASELRQLRPLKGDEWLQAFYRCWTQKEAVLKAEGVGLNLELASFDVAVAPEERAGLIATRAALRCWWKLFDLCPAPGTIGALASGDPEATVRCFSV